MLLRSLHGTEWTRAWWPWQKLQPRVTLATMSPQLRADFRSCASPDGASRSSRSPQRALGTLGTGF